MSEPNELSFEIKNSDEVPLDTYKSLALLDRYVKTCLMKQCDVDLTLKDGSTRKIVFNVIKKVGQGSYGIVSKIKEQGNKNEMALKAVYLNSNHYYREIDILRQLTHPNIIDLIGYYKIKMKTKTDTGIQSNTCVCLITPYVRYTMLDALKNRVTYLPYLKKMYKQALSALEYMHSKNICHRDIKPTNILIDENYNLYICDLGSAKELKDDENNVSYICSRYYRAPECCLGNPNYDCKIDIWSLGIVFTDLETDYLLFVNKNNQDQLVEMQNFLILTKEDCKEMKLPVKPNGIGIEEYLKRKGTNTDLIEVLSNSIVMNPRKRATARMLLDMKYFRNETEMSI